MTEQTDRDARASGLSDSGVESDTAAEVTLAERLRLVTCAHDLHDMEHVCSQCVLVHIEPLLAAREAAARAEERERVAVAIEAEVARFGRTDVGDPVRAGLIEGYRDAARIARTDGAGS